MGAGLGNWPAMHGARLERAERPEVFRMTEFTSAALFAGDLYRFADRAGQVPAKVARIHPVCCSLLQWAEAQPDPITEYIERGATGFGVDMSHVSTAFFDLLLERTGPRLNDERKNAGFGRVLEFWRLLKRDCGTSSADAQMALQDSGSAPDRWEALGREPTRPVDDDFRFLALRELIPKSLGDWMLSQFTLRLRHGGGRRRGGLPANGSPPDEAGRHRRRPGGRGRARSAAPRAT